jgi:hypothetical protein
MTRLKKKKNVNPAARSLPEVNKKQTRNGKKI